MYKPGFEGSAKAKCEGHICEAPVLSLDATRVDPEGLLPQQRQRDEGDTAHEDAYDVAKDVRDLEQVDQFGDAENVGHDRPVVKSVQSVRNARQFLVSVVVGIALSGCRLVVLVQFVLVRVQSNYSLGLSKCLGSTQIWRCQMKAGRLQPGTADRLGIIASVRRCRVCRIHALTVEAR